MDKRLEEFVLRNLRDLKGNSSRSIYLDETLGSFCIRMGINMEKISLKEMNDILWENKIQGIPAEVIHVYDVEYYNTSPISCFLKKNYFLDSSIFREKLQQHSMQNVLMEYFQQKGIDVQSLNYEIIDSNGLRDTAYELIDKIIEIMESSTKDTCAIADALFEAASPYISVYDLETEIKYKTKVGDVMTLDELLKKGYNNIELKIDEGDIINISGCSTHKNLPLEAEVEITGYNCFFDDNHLTVEAEIK